MTDSLAASLLTRIDWLIVVVLICATLAYLEWALARRFGRHEVVEAKQYAALALTAESAAGAAALGVRHLTEIRADVDSTKVQLQTFLDRLQRHEARLAAIEERYMRAALLNPAIIRMKEDP